MFLEFCKDRCFNISFFFRKDISTLVVRAGEWDLKTEKELLSHQDRRVSKIVTHPDYYAGGLYNDVALIFTENPFSLQDNIQLMCLPSSNDIFINDMCYSSGWGKTVSYNNYTIVKKTESGKISMSINVIKIINFNYKCNILFCRRIWSISSQYIEKG